MTVDAAPAALAGDSKGGGEVPTAEERPLSAAGTGADAVVLAADRGGPPAPPPR